MGGFLAGLRPSNCAIPIVCSHDLSAVLAAAGAGSEDLADAHVVATAVEQVVAWFSRFTWTRSPPAGRVVMRNASRG